MPPKKESSPKKASPKKAAAKATKATKAAKPAKKAVKPTKTMVETVADAKKLLGKDKKKPARKSTMKAVVEEGAAVLARAEKIEQKNKEAEEEKSPKKSPKKCACKK
eukprot:TRINITY_DN10628_c0_g1_i1.p1 TRINITY_DN10628_c0_g1~~TRINITY_DN10628_c0_g1_i1.p1  ORF type:complete len:119 (-),score=38.83 TRINITY_DN10628_c0_g1_i1:86-406(-)